MLEVILFAKGFASLACHRVSHQRWKQKQQQGQRQQQQRKASNSTKAFLSLWLQSTVSAVFGVDIHPAATIGSAVMFDHATGIVVGETAVIGSGSTLLHSVTLGGTGKASGVDRHPKIGQHVLIGAGAKILGNIHIGEAAKIGAGSVVLRAIPPGATAGSSNLFIFFLVRLLVQKIETDTCLNFSLFSSKHLFSSTQQWVPQPRSLDIKWRQILLKRTTRH
jgi:serine O-acetyltransferase